MGNVELKIVDKYGNVVNKGNDGIIHIKSPSIYSGYVFGESKYESLYKDWYNTGDIGYIDQNDELHIVGRIDELIIIHSHKIFPSSVEKEVRNVLGIDECIVMSVDFRDDPIVVCLYTGEKCNGEKIKKKLSFTLMKYEIPRFFFWCKEIKKTSNGKISLHHAKDMVVEFLENMKS